MKHPVIIGAGGVASYLLPLLIKAFRPKTITIFDKDILEERNLDRQMFRPNQIGLNKASALAACNQDPDTDYQIVPQWFTDASTLPEETDAIICVADNHMARAAALRAVEYRDCRVYIGGNEFFDHEAYVFHRDWANTARDPRKRYPEILTDHTGSPTSCQGVAQVASPQLAIANFGCAAHILHLLYIYETFIPANGTPETLFPYELRTSIQDLHSA